MHQLIEVLSLLLAGGVATSVAEYKLHYNLVDLVKDKVLALVAALKAKL